MGIGDWEISGDSSLIKLIIVYLYESIFGKCLNNHNKDEPPIKLSEEEELERLKEFEDKKEHYYFCKYCGNIHYPPSDMKGFYRDFAQCLRCGRVNSYIFSERPREYYEKSSIKPGCFFPFNNGCSPEDLLFVEEIERNPSFSSELYWRAAYLKAGYKKDPHPKYRGMKCGACKSVCYYHLIVSDNIDTKYRYVCGDCGYKW